MLWALVLLWCAPRAGVGYVVLTKEGYSVEHKLLAQAGARIGENSRRLWPKSTGTRAMETGKGVSRPAMEKANGARSLSATLAAI